MGEVFFRRIAAEVRGSESQLILFTQFSADDDVESGALRVEATDGRDYWRTTGALHADDLSQSLAVGRMHTALEALTTKFKSSRTFEYTLDEDNILHIRFTIGKVRNRLRVTLQPVPAPAQAVVAAFGGLGANLRGQRTAVRTLSNEEAVLRTLTDWGKEKMATVGIEGDEAAERAAGGTAVLLLEKTKELRMAMGTPEEPDEEIDEMLAGLEALELSVESEDAENLVPKTSAAVEERRAESPDRGSETAGRVEGVSEEEDFEEMLAGGKGKENLGKSSG